MLDPKREKWSKFSLPFLDKFESWTVARCCAVLKILKKSFKKNLRAMKIFILIFSEFFRAFFSQNNSPWKGHIFLKRMTTRSPGACLVRWSKRACMMKKKKLPRENDTTCDIYWKKMKNRSKIKFSPRSLCLLGLLCLPCVRRTWSPSPFAFANRDGCWVHRIPLFNHGFHRFGVFISPSVQLTRTDLDGQVVSSANRNTIDLPLNIGCLHNRIIIAPFVW